jgi:ribA/ribD-fused uncharacterized protein
MGPKTVFFWRPEEENGWLSTWSEHGFVVNEVHFRTAEHFVMYYKALEMRDLDTAAKIWRARTPRDANALGRNVKNFDERKWTAIKLAVMDNALLAKIEAHPDLERMLRATAGAVLAEASPSDTEWGIGWRRTDPQASTPELWRGANRLGESWMRVRRSIYQ